MVDSMIPRWDLIQGASSKITQQFRTHCSHDRKGSNCALKTFTLPTHPSPLRDSYVHPLHPLNLKVRNALHRHPDETNPFSFS